MNQQTYYDMVTGKEYLLDPTTKKWHTQIELESLFDWLKKDWLYDANKMKYWFFPPELSHKLYLIVWNDSEKKEIVLDYLMKNIIDTELKREDFVFMFITDRTVKTKTWEKNIKESLIVRTNYYKAIWAVVKNKIKKIINPNTDKIEASKHKEIIEEIDTISEFACFAENFVKNKESFDTKKRQIIHETLKSIFWDTSTIIIPRDKNTDIRIIKSWIKIEKSNNIDFNKIERKLFPITDDLRKFLSTSANKIWTETVLTSRTPDNLFIKKDFASKLASFLKHNKQVKELALNKEQLELFSSKILEKDLSWENIIINTIIKKLLNILNSWTSKWLWFYNFLINKVLRGNIPEHLQKKVEPKIRIDRSREYIQYQRDLLLKKETQVNPNVITMYEKDVLIPLVEAVKIYMSK